MQSIVTTIDDPYREQVENVWGELKAVFGLKQLTGATAPHFTYQAADAYDPVRIDAALSHIAGSTAPFTVETGGTGILRGPRYVLYVPVLDDVALLRLHGRIWSDAPAAATGLKPVHAAETWLPHITLAIGQIDEPQFEEVMRFLNAREQKWTIRVTNVSVIPDAATTPERWQRYELRGRA